MVAVISKSRVAIALVGFVSIGLAIYIAVFDGEISIDRDSDVELTDNPFEADQTNIRDASDFESSRSVPTDEFGPMVAIEPANQDTATRNSDWAKSLFENPETGVLADRYRFVDFDWFTLIKHIESTPVYLAAASGQTVSQDDSTSNIDLALPLFQDLVLQLKITDVQIKNSNGLERWVLRGDVVKPSVGRFNLTIRNNPNRIRGQIDTSYSHIRIETPKDASATVIAEFNRERTDAEKRPID